VPNSNPSYIYSSYQRYVTIRADNIEFSGAIKYLKVVKYSLSNVIIKVLHLIPWSISNANQNNGERIVTENQNIPHLGQIHKQEKLQKKFLYLAPTMELMVACSCGLSLPCGVSGFLVTLKNKKTF